MMCLVEVGNAPKPQASCALPFMPNMRIYTNTALVRKAQEFAMESLLLHHALDCPVCDQGGECELQNKVLTTVLIEEVFIYLFLIFG